MVRLETTNMAEGSVSLETTSAAPQVVSGEVKSPIPGMPHELFNTLSKRHSLQVIQEQRARYKTDKEFLADAEREAERIRSAQSLKHMSLSLGQVIRGKTVDASVLANAQLNDVARARAAGELLYGKGKELSEQQKQELEAAHEEALTERGLDEEYLAGVYNFTREQIRRKVEKLPSFTLEERRKLFEAGLVGPATPFKKLEAAAERSKIEEASRAVVYAKEPGAIELINSDPTVKTYIDEKRHDLETALYPQNETEQKELECVLSFMTDRIGNAYTAAMRPEPKAVSDWSAPREPKTLDDKIKDIHEALDNYKERFWDYGLESFKKVFEEAGLPAPDEAKLAQLKAENQGLASFIAQRAGIAIEKELRGERSFISKRTEQELMSMPAAERKARFRTMAEYQKTENIGDFYLLDIKAELLATRGVRERERRELRKRATARERLHYNDWRDRFDFLWAETAEELDDSLDDWLDLFQNALPEKAEDLEYQDVQQWLANIKSAHEKALSNIGIDPASVIAEAQRDKYESSARRVAAARMVDKKKGMEYFLKLKQDNAAKYDAYEDATYLREGFAIMADKIAEKDGAYYKGGPPNVHKPLPGETKAYRDEIRRKAIEYGATHQLYITKKDIENAELGEAEIRREVMREVRLHNQTPNAKRLTSKEAEKLIQQRLDDKRDRNERGNRYGWDDSIEEMLLVNSEGLLDAQRRAKSWQERDEALAKVEARTKVFVDIKDMLDKMDITDEERAAGKGSLYGLTPEERRQRIRDRIRTEMDKRKAGARREEIDDFDMQDTETYKNLYRAFQGSNSSQAQIQVAIDVHIASDPNLQQVISQEIQDVKDKALWEWVEEYNRPRLAKKENASDALPWFPSYWDEERLLIRRPEDVIDRRLTPEEFRAMVEKIDDPYDNMTDKQIQQQIRGEFEEDIQREVLAKNLPPDKTQQEYVRLLEEREKEIKDKIEGILFERQQRLTKAIRNFNLNVDDDKFKGLEARWGGLTTRVVNKETGELELTTVYKEAFAILKAKKEADKQAVERELKEWEEGYEATHPGKTINAYEKEEIEQIKEWEKQHPGLTLNAYDWEEIKWRAEFKTLNPDLTQAQYDEYVRAWRIGYKAAYNPTNEELAEDRNAQRRLLRRNHTMATILGLEEIGLADYLPIVLYYGYSDESIIGAFAPLVGYTDDDKGALPELIDRPRKEMEAVWYFMGEQHMDGKVLEVVDRKPGLIVKDKNGKVKPAHEERWVRARVINPGGNLKLRGIFEMMFMISTSGGVEVTPLAHKIAQLEVWDEGLENGQEDKLRLHGFRKRRCKWEYRQQSFFNPREYADPLTYVDRLAGALEARKYLVGGEVQGKGHLPGVLIEPMSGAYKYRDMFFDEKIWSVKSLKTDKLTQEADTKSKSAYLEALEVVLNDVDELKNLPADVKDKLVEVGAGILKPLIDYMDARRYLMNRAGLAPKNWKYDNEIIANAYFAELFDEATMGAKNLEYAKQGRNLIAVEIFRGILETSTYHILVGKDREVMYPRAQETKLEMDKQRSRSALTVLPQAVQTAITPIITTKRNDIEAKQKDQQVKLVGKRQELETKEAAHTVLLNKKKQELQQKNKSKEEIETEVEKLAVEQFKQIEPLVIEVNKLAVPLNKERLAVEDEVAELIDDKLSAQLRDQLAVAKQQLVAGNAVINPIALNLPPEILKMLNTRWKFLVDHHVQSKTSKKDGLKRIKPRTDNIEAELKRLLDQYLDTKLHMEFVGEWPARLLAPDFCKLVRESKIFE
ncbi:hypothetical protein HYU93_05280 [Candidatus Daviesbacteria bacterium]|nr:hypothetical protein [Candidatus Daviesbacteria bacterium]